MDDWDSDDSSRRSRSNRAQRTSRNAFNAKKKNKQRMSIMTSKYFDVPPVGTDDCDPDPYRSVHSLGKKSRRRFFQSEARWDEAYQTVMVGKRTMAFPFGNGMHGMSAEELMENKRQPDEKDDGEDDEDMSIDP